MASLPGGAANKLGNRYEHWWTAVRIADVLTGRATYICPERVGSAGRGVEFEVGDAEGCWREQVKQNRQRWTVKRLEDEGVLAEIEEHLAANVRVRLIVSSGAEELAKLSDRARTAQLLQEFKQMVPTSLSGDYAQLQRTWNLSPEETWKRLYNLHVEHHPSESLRRLVRETYSRLVIGDPETAVNELRGLIEDNLNRRLTHPEIWSHLEAKGFRRRLLAGDAETAQALRKSVQRHWRRVNDRAPSLGTVASPYADKLRERIISEPDRQVWLVDGSAGFGKSTVAAEAVNALEADGWFAAAVSLDSVEPTARTPAALGKQAGLWESPLTLLAGVADDAPAVLLIDQLDAVSTFSGRMPDVYESVRELLDDMPAAPNVRVILIVRSVDLENDPRLRALTHEETGVGGLTVDRLDTESLDHLLVQNGIEPADLQPVTRELLRVPLHFAVFSQLPAETQRESFETLQQLYFGYVRESRRQLEQQLGSIDWDGITGQLARFLSDQQRLSAPSSVLDAASSQEVGALESAGIIERKDEQVAFFHETFFDFVFARSFVAHGRELHVFLAETTQDLFRRAQTRQILEYLAGADRYQFRTAISQLLFASDIRSHLKDVAVGVLRNVDATADDWATVEPVSCREEDPIAAKVRDLLATPAWFDAADQLGRWEAWLGDADIVDQVYRQLILVARERPRRVEALVRPHLGESETWRQRLVALIAWSLTPELADFAIELVRRGDLDDAQGPIAVNSDFFSIVYALYEDDANAAARLTGAYLQRKLEAARSEGHSDPFESGHVPVHSPAGKSVLSSLAASAPATLIDEILPFVVDVADRSAPPRHASLRVGRWTRRYIEPNLGLDAALFTAVETASRTLAAKDADKAFQALEQLGNSDIDALRFLACRIWSALDRPDEAIEWLVADEANLQLGWSGGRHWASRELIESASPHCDDQRLEALETTLLHYEPRHERQADARSLRRRGQYELISALPENRMSPAGKKRLGELQRKFQDRPPAPPRGVEGGKVAPPISEERVPYMTDDDWRRALAKYRNDVTQWTDSGPVGGARELARLLGNQAADEAHRFTELALTLEGQVPPEVFGSLIENVATKLDVDTLGRLLRHARNVAGADVGRAICDAIRKVAEEADDTLIGLLEEHLGDTDPDEEVAKIKTESGNYIYDGDLLTAGLNSTRGAAALALAAILTSRQTDTDRLAPLVHRLATDSVLAVRACAAEAVFNLLRQHPDVGLQYAQELFNADTDVFDAPTSERLLTHAFLCEPDRFVNELSRALNSPKPLAQRGGRVWAVAKFREMLENPLPQEVEELGVAARRGAAEMFSVDPQYAFKDLERLFNDQDQDVQETAATALRQLGDMSVDTVDELIHSFAQSQAVDEHLEQLLLGINERQGKVPPSVLAACEVAVRTAGPDMGDIRTRHAATSKYLITIVLRLYRQGDIDSRRRCLDVIDRLSEVSAYGLAEALEEVR